MRALRKIVLSLAAVGVLAAVAVSRKGPREPTPNVAAGPLPGLADADTPRWWKGNLHTHSLWSDGNDYPEMIADWYKRHGYHFLTLSDHNVLSEGRRWTRGGRGVALKKYLDRFGPAWVERKTIRGAEHVRLKPLVEFRSVLEEPGRFLLIQGEEITQRFRKYPVHLNGINLRDVVPPTDGVGVSETIRVNRGAVADQSRRAGRPMLTFLNHPNFVWGVTAEEMARAETLKFFEVFNGHPSVRNYGDKAHPGTERMWDIALALRLGRLKLPILYGVATDDAHRYHNWGVGKVNPGRAWVMVKAPYLTAGAVVEAMHRGDFYATTGVALNDIRSEKNCLTLNIRAEAGVTYKTEFIATTQDASLDSKPRPGAKDKVTRLYSKDIGRVVATSDSPRPSYTFTGKELYVRAKVTSSKPHPNPYRAGDTEVAWTQPVRP